MAALSLLVAVLAASCLKLLAKGSEADRVNAVMERVAALDPSLQSKICAHRANNVPKYRAAIQLFDCVEIDVVIEPATADSVSVYHPPVENHIGLSLAFLLQNEPLPDGRLWIDVKDLSASNWERFLKLLNGLVPQESRPDIVIETGWRESGVERATTAFRAEGYSISYYLPTQAAIECKTTRTDTCDQLRADVIRTISRGFSHLSFDARAYPFVNTIRDQLPSSTNLLTWDITPAWPQLSLLQDVEIYIIRFPHRFST